MARNILLGLAFLCLVSCKKDDSKPDGQRIYSKYYLDYDAGTDKTTASVSFSDNTTDGEQLKEQEKTSVYFNDDELAFDTVSQHYVKVYDGFKTSGTFKWEDDVNGFIFKNSASIEPAVLPASIDTISLSKGTSIKWQEAAVSAGETVNLIINGDDANDVTTVSTSTGGASSIAVDASDLSIYKAGKTAKLSLTRVKSVDAAERTNAGGVVSTTYAGSVQKILFKK